MKTRILLIGILIYSNSMFAQSMSETPETKKLKEKKNKPFIGVGFFPKPIYICFSAGLEIRNNKENNLVYSRIYVKAGNFNIENTFHSYFIEVTFKLKKFEFKNNSTITLETPIWLGNRNIIETFVEERHEHHDYTYLQVGTGLDLNYSFSKRWTIISKFGVGFGPQYNFAGDFNFSNYHFEKFSWLPLADIGIRYNL